MDTLQVYKCLKTITQKKKAHFDVIPCDYLNNFTIRSYPLLLCVNNMPSTHPGQHWLGLFIKQKGSEVEFYDSYGMGMEYYDKSFINFAMNQNVNVLENKIPVQGNYQNSCGHFVIFFLYNRLSGCSRHALYCKFSNDFEKNDKIVRRFVKRVFIKNLKCNIDKTQIQCCKCKNEYDK